MARWERCESSEVAGGRFLVVFKSRECRVAPTFHLFVSDVDQRNDGVGCVQEDLAWPQR